MNRADINFWFYHRNTLKSRKNHLTPNFSSPPARSCQCFFFSFQPSIGFPFHSQIFGSQNSLSLGTAIAIAAAGVRKELEFNKLTWQRCQSTWPGRAQLEGSSAGASCTAAPRLAQAAGCVADAPTLQFGNVPSSSGFALHTCNARVRGRYCNSEA